jgi:hypothetical protein
MFNLMQEFRKEDSSSEEEEESEDLIQVRELGVLGSILA